MAGEIISERRATSNRNGGRHHRGFAGDFPRNPHSGSARAKSERWIFPFRGNAGKVRYQRLAVFAQSVEYNVVAVIHEVGERGREPYNSLPLHEQSRFESSRFIY